MKQRTSQNIGLFMLGAVVSFFLQSLSHKSSLKSSLPEEARAMQLTSGEAQVYTHDGTSLRRLTGFCALTPLYDCTFMYVTSGKVPVYIHHTKTSGVSGAIYETGRHEPEIMDVIMAELNKYPDAGFVDIGSNIGPFSIHAAKHGRKVVAADAVIDNIQKLCKSVENNGLHKNVTMVINPVSDSHTSVSIANGESETFEMAKVKSIVDQSTNCGDRPTSFTVMLDDMLKISTFKSAVLKIDVEGFEYHVINGGRAFLKELSVPSVIMEWKHVKKTAHGNHLVDIMNTFGYKAYDIKRYLQTKVMLPYDDYINWPGNIVWTLS